MTDGMGYRNYDRVYLYLAQEGKLSKRHGDSYTLDHLAENMMLYMAKTAIDKEDTKAIGQNRPYWCYWDGWESLAYGTGMVPTPQQIHEDSGDDVEEFARIVTSRLRTAVARLSRKAKFLQDQGCIKLLRPGIGLDPNRRHATWLLLLGDESENAAAEAWARKCLRLPAK